MDLTYDAFHAEALARPWPSFSSVFGWRREKAAATESTGGRALQDRRRRILVVDDHDDTLRSMKLLLTKLGYHVLAADTMTEALRLAEEEEFDILLSDIGLPDGSGHELLRRIREKRQVRALALSGYGMDEDLARSRDAGFFDHLTKPVSIDRLRSAIEELEAQPD